MSPGHRLCPFKGHAVHPMSEPSKPVVDDEDAMSVALAELREVRSAAAAEPVGTDEPVASATPAVESEPEAKTDDKTPDPKAADTTAPAKVKTAEEKLAEAEAELHRRKSDDGRVSALNRKYQESQAEAAKLREQLAAKGKPPATEEEARSKLDELAEQIKDFPELKAIVDTVGAALKEVEGKAKAHAKEAAEEAVKPLAPLRQQHQDQQEQEQAAADAADLKTFQDTYPTAGAVINTGDFKAWLPKQSPAIQWAFAKGQTPSDALPVMDAYDAHLRRIGKPSIASTPITQQSAADETKTTEAKQPDNRLARATGIPSRAGSAGKGSLPPSDDFDGSLEFFRNKRIAQERAAAA